MPFYKKEGNDLLCAPTSVLGPGFDLQAETKDQHEYPIDGWYWYDTLDAAMLAMATPPEIVSVTMRQARLALLHAGKLAAVETVIATLPSPQKEAAKIEWEYANTVDRVSTLTSLLGSAAGMTEAEMDSLFAVAATL